MLKLLSFLATLHVIHGSCPDGFDLVKDGQCRGTYGKMHNQDHDTGTPFAIKTCKEIGGQPIIIHDDEHQSYFTKRIKLWTPLGIVCNNATKKWEWADGSPLDYRPPATNCDAGVLETPCDVNRSWYINSTGYWSGSICTGCMMTDADNWCTTQLHPAAPGGDGCDSFADDSEDGECYAIGETAENWQDAQMICKKLGANLASLHNSKENTFVRRLAVSGGAVNGLFLGATYTGKSKDFGWVDGSDWDYTNFHPGFPMDGFGDCLAMDTSISTGQWMNMDCTAKLPVACIRDQKPVVEPSCGPGPWVENTIITSPGFPFSSSTFCDYFLTVEAGKRVELEIVFLEANSCCDSLVLYDGYLGASVLATVTGEAQNVTFTTTSANIMRVNWQPNGGVNVRGVAMTFRGV